jgi:hypothetical protein
LRIQHIDACVHDTCLKEAMHAQAAAQVRSRTLAYIVCCSRCWFRKHDIEGRHALLWVNILERFQLHLHARLSPDPERVPAPAHGEEFPMRFACPQGYKIAGRQGAKNSERPIFGKGKQCANLSGIERREIYRDANGACRPPMIKPSAT